MHRSPDKKFRQSVKDKSTVSLYRLPAVVKAVADGQTVYVVEGEKDVHALEALGAVATTAPEGAANWHRVDPTPLHGGNVVVIPDKDEAGDRYAARVLDSLDGMVSASGWSLAKVGKDAADHIAAGYELDDFEHTSWPMRRRWRASSSSHRPAPSPCARCTGCGSSA